jgi:lambda family phage tail tape measure protein
MTEAMKTASVVGEQYSVSMEDAATALTLLAKVNISGTAAGTSLRNMVKELYAPVPQAASAMRKLGLETKDAAGNLKPFADIIYDLKGKLEDFDKAGQVQILQRLFGERGAKEAVAMLALTRDEWEKMKSSISDSEGFMKGVTDDLNAEMKGVWRQTINTFEAELISAYKQVEPVLLDVVKSLKEALTSDEFVSGLRSMISGVTSVLSLVVEYAPLIVNAAKAWLVYKAAMIGASVWTATAGAVGAFSAAMMGLSGVMGPGMTAMAGAKGILAGLAMTLTKIPSPLTLVAGLLAGGAAAWMAWGESGDAALDRVRKMADKAAESVQGLNDLISDIRFDKVSRDVSTRQILDGYKALNTEVDKYKKSLEEVTGSPVELDEQFKPKGQGPSRFMVEAHAELNELRKVLVQKKSALEEATQLNVDRSVGENGELDLTSHGKQRPFRNVKDILGGGAGGGKGGKLGKDWEFEAEKVAIAAVTALQQKEIALLESRNANKLISEEQYQEDLKAIYERFAPTIEALYEQGTDRLAKISASTKGEERERADSHHKQLLADQSKYQNEAELRLQKALDKELGMKLQAQKKADEAIAKARASSQEATDRLRDTKLKLDMTPESAAAYDAGNKSDALFNDAMADRQATIDFMRNRRGLTEENAELREQIKLLEDLKNAKAGARVEAERTAREESAYSRSFEAGWKRAYRAYTDEAANASMYAAKTFNLGVSSMEQALDEFINTGTVDWQKMSRTIILEMAKMELRWLMSKMMNPEGTGAGPGESFGKAIAGLFSSKEEKKPASAAPLSTSGLQGGIDLAPNFESLRYQLDTASMGLATLNANMNGAQLGVSGLGATASTTGMSVSNMTMSTDTAGVALQNVAGAGDDAATSLGRVATSGGAGAAGGGGGSSGLWGMLAGAVANYFVPGSGALVGGIVNAGVAASNKNYTGAATSLVGAAAGSNFGGSEAAITAGSDTLYGPPKPSANGNTFGEGALHRFKIGGTFGRQGLQAFAKGGAFTNHIVTEPTHFKFANGGEMASGLMGEAGPEAVMPLGRDSRGKLGVHLASAGPAQQSAPPPPPQNNIRIVNAFDTGVVGDYMGSADGEKIIMNAVKRNQNTIKQMSRV